MPQIRVAVPGDVHQIQELAAEAPTASRWSADHYESFFAPQLVQDSLLFVADHNGTVIGFLAARAVSGECEIESIVVRRSRQREGTGSELLKQLLSKVSGRVQRVFLEVRVSNQPAIRLYESAGFSTVGRRKNYYQDPAEDALVMKKSLVELD